MNQKKLMAGGLAAIAFIATAGAAMAAPAYATSNINVRSGPGTNYSTIDTLQRGERVDVQSCRGSWCFVEKAGPDGWVSSSYLDRGQPQRPDWDRPNRPNWDRPNYDRPNWDRPGRPGWDRPHRPGWDRPNYDRPDYGRPDWDRPGRPVYPTRPDANFCFNGPNGYFCAGS